ncbi:MAG: hypothetical protein N2C14_29160 [Planctomycetales bacterium]
MRLTFSAALLALTVCVAQARADEYSIAELKEPAPADAVSPEVAKTLAKTGFRVSLGEKTICDLWLRGEWPGRTGFKPSASVLYPFSQGDLIGVARYHAGKKHTDFRQQRIRSGAYTLRYGLQPEDGNHVGTSDTRDFLMVIKADDDKTTKAPDQKSLFEKSSAAVGSDHPCMLSMTQTSASPKDVLSIHHEEDEDWWIVRVPGLVRKGEKKQPLSVEFVIVGFGEE